MSGCQLYQQPLDTAFIRIIAYLNLDICVLGIKAFYGLFQFGGQRVQRGVDQDAVLRFGSGPVLPACGAGGENPGVTTLIYANLTELEGLGPDREWIDRFNRTHEDVRIEVRDYFDENGKSGRERLLTEMMAGEVPDIIDLGYTPYSYGGACILPYRSLAQKGYLENLWPYIKNDPELGPDSVLTAPLKAAEIDGGLYAAFSKVFVESLVGSADVVGDKYGWTMAEFQKAFSTMPEGSIVGEFFWTKSEVYFRFGARLLDSYVDWEAGECNFDSESFRTVLEFMNSFPAENICADWDGHETIVKVGKDVASGRQMVLSGRVSQPLDFQINDTVFDGRAAYIGYPVENGGIGSYFVTGTTRLAISSLCKDKEAAWEFVRYLFLPKYDFETILDIEGIPINRADYDTLVAYSCSNRVRKKYPKGYPKFSLASPLVPIHPVTEEELARYEQFINSIDQTDLRDPVLYRIVKEAAGAYFAGDKTLDETVQLIQNRAMLYVNEQR